MRILITGGLGFIGRACIPRFLKRGCDMIRVLDNLEPSVHGTAPDINAYGKDWAEGVEVTIGSITNRELVGELLCDVDAVLHLASLTSVPRSMCDSGTNADVNITGTAHLADLLAEHASVQRVTLASSRAVYGEGPYRCRNGCRPGVPSRMERTRSDHEHGLWDPVCRGCGIVLAPLPAGESTTPQPVSGYGLTKLVQEQLLRLSLPLHRARVTVFRLQNVYGPGQSRAVPDVGVANNLTQQALRGETVKLFEDGKQVRDFVFIDDVADLLVAATLSDLSDERCGIFNVGTGTGTTLRALAETIFDAAGLPRKITVSGDYRLGDVRHSVAATEHLSAAYPWSPVSLKDGVARLTACLRSHGHPCERRMTPV